jgi:hypothetical protein
VIVAPYVLDVRTFAPKLADVARLLEARRLPGDRSAVWVGLHDLESCNRRDDRRGRSPCPPLRHRNPSALRREPLNVERTRARTAVRRSRSSTRSARSAPGRCIAHCVWADDADIALLAARVGSSVGALPHANLKLGSGIAPVPAMRAAACASPSPPTARRRTTGSTSST